MLNKIKTAILLSLMTGLFMLLGTFFGGTFGLGIALIFALIMNFITYFYSDKIVLRIYKARPLDKDQYANVYNIITELSQKMDLPMPKLWLIETQMANAFATGRNPENSSVAVTTGILSILDERELRGVLAHELSHIKNRDILITTIAATMAAAIGYIANMMQYAAIWGSGSSDKKKGNPIAMLLVAILMPIAATLIQLAISRSREYLADETGAECCHDPLALASALEKLHGSIKHSHLNNDTVHASTASLFIVHPFASIDWLSLFSTHPPMHKRIAKLRQIHENMH